LTNVDYSTEAKNIVSQGVFTSTPSFQTFCLEVNEHAVSPSYFIISGAAVRGGTGTYDTTSQGTAYLYSQFAQGLFNTTPFYPASGPRSIQAGLLQAAIWALEDERDLTGVNLYYDLAMSHGGMADAPYAGYLGVYVLNNYEDKDRKIWKQDFLYFHVPDGGATLMLLGGALMALGALRRKLGR
jgi:hypothetical protein